MKLLALFSLAALATACADRGHTTPNDRDTFTGRLYPTAVAEYTYIPFDVPGGATSIHVSYAYTNATSSKVDIGVFDERGYTIEDARNATTGFRGWSFNLLDNFTFTPAETTPMYVGGPVASGTWHVLVANTQIAGEYVDYNITVEYGYEAVAGPRFSVQYAASDLGLDAGRRARMDNGTDGQVWLKGDFHVHTTYSDGSYTPTQQVEHALQQELDFYISTEHNSRSGNDVMGAFAPDEMGLLVGRGMEVTTRFGHWQAVGLEAGQTVEWRYGPDGNNTDTGYADAAAQVHRAGGFVSVNHPYMPCKECIWNLDPEFKYNDAMEIWNDGVTQDINEAAIALWQSLLVEGRRITGIGGSDTHHPPSMVGRPCTRVKASSLSTAAIVEGVKRRRVYIANQSDMEIDFTVAVNGTGTGGQTGDAIETNGQAVTARLATSGFDGHTACFVTEKGYILNQTVSDNEPLSIGVAAWTKFLRVELRNSTGTYTGLTNPIFFD